MGCWNETCALSNLPIVPGDKVVWMLLSPGYGGDVHRVYYNDQYFVRTVPIYGTYSDYGEVELIDTKVSIEILKTIREQFESDLCETDVQTMDNYCFKTLQSWLHEGNIRVDADNKSGKIPPNIKPVHNIMIKKEVWDEFLDMTVDGWIRNSSSTINLKSIREHADEIINSVFKERNSEFNTAYLDALGNYDNLFSELNISTGFAGASPPFERQIKETSRKLLRGLSDGVGEYDAVRRIFYRIAELNMVEIVMGSARMNWHLTTGRGIQSEDNLSTMEVHMRIAKCAKLASERQLSNEEEELERNPDYQHGINIVDRMRSQYNKNMNLAKDLAKE